MEEEESLLRSKIPACPYTSMNIGPARKIFKIKRSHTFGSCQRMDFLGSFNLSPSDIRKPRGVGVSDVTKIHFSTTPRSIKENPFSHSMLDRGTDCCYGRLSLPNDRKYNAVLEDPKDTMGVIGLSSSVVGDVHQTCDPLLCARISGPASQ